MKNQTNTRKITSSIHGRPCKKIKNKQMMTTTTTIIWLLWYGWLNVRLKKVAPKNANTIVNLNSRSMSYSLLNDRKSSGAHVLMKALWLYK
jgi:hypothetical protein